MDSQATRSASVHPTLTKQRAPTPSESEMQVLTSYMLGHITLAEANDLLYQLGHFIIAICGWPAVSV